LKKISLDKVKRIKSKYEKELLRKENVVGVGIGKKNITEELCIKVYVTIKKLESQLEQDQIVPKILEGIKTDIVESGKIRFQKTDQ
jgi:hypothetical protein